MQFFRFKLLAFTLFFISSSLAQPEITNINVYAKDSVYQYQLEDFKADTTPDNSRWVPLVQLDSIEFKPEYLNDSLLVFHSGDTNRFAISGYLDSIKVERTEQATFTDPNTAATYKYTVIGTQTWMAENVNNTTMNYNTFMNGEAASTTVPSGVQGVCPNGWHIPSRGEWEILTDYLSANASGSHWQKADFSLRSRDNEFSQGTNEFGFNAEATDRQGAVYFALSEFSGQWSGYAMYVDGSMVPTIRTIDIGSQLNVRCVKD